MHLQLELRLGNRGGAVHGQDQLEIHDGCLGKLPGTAHSGHRRRNDQGGQGGQQAGK